jgi:hypothetical protein
MIRKAWPASRSWTDSRRCGVYESSSWSNNTTVSRSQIRSLVWSVNWAEDELGSRCWGNRL